MSEHSNLRRLRVWLDHRVAEARRKPALERPAYVEGWCAWLGTQMDALAHESTPKHLVGLTAFDLANARDVLASCA